MTTDIPIVSNRDAEIARRIEATLEDKAPYLLFIDVVVRPELPPGRPTLDIFIGLERILRANDMMRAAVHGLVMDCLVLWSEEYDDEDLTGHFQLRIEARTGVPGPRSKALALAESGHAPRLRRVEDAPPGLPPGQEC